MRESMQLVLLILIFNCLPDAGHCLTHSTKGNVNVGPRNTLEQLKQNGEDSTILPVRNGKQQFLFQEKHRPRSGYCDKRGFHVIIRSNLTVPPLDVDSVHISYNRSTACKPKFKNSQWVMFQFPQTDCGAKFKLFRKHISYWVTVYGGKVVQGSIFHDPQFKLTVQCTYMLHGAATLRTQVQRAISGQHLTLKDEGMLHIKMRFAKDASYSSFDKDSGSSKYVLGDPVFAEVLLLKLEDRELELYLKDCWATPSQDPQDVYRWNLLTDGCPFHGDSRHTEIISVSPGERVKYPQHHKRFMIRMFSFVKSQDSQALVYIHCNAEVCKGVKCSLSPCNRESRHLRPNQDKGNRNGGLQVSEGPLLLNIMA